MEQEQKHFQECLDVVRENIRHYKQKVEEGKKETEELYAAFTSGDTELYNQLVVSQDIQEHNENVLRKNQAALQKPYFGRVDYQEQGSGQKESLYIGKNGVSRDKADVMVIDWRAPVSALYYENELGSGSYHVPEVGNIAVDLQLKRTFDISQGKLAGYFDNDTAATDELLVKYLSQNKDLVLNDIISTIQKEQNEIIRETPFADLIVQGVAGSGKTTVAMHRISYILYNYGKRFSPDEFCIIGSNDMLLGYITSGLPELDVHHVSQKRMDVFFRDLLGKEWKKRFALTEVAAGEAWKSTLAFAKELEGYLQGLWDRLVPEKNVVDGQIGVILPKESIHSARKENPGFSIQQMFRLLNGRLKDRVRFLVAEEGRLRKEKIKEYANYFKWAPGQKNIVTIYQDFLVEYGASHSVDIKGLSGRVKKGQFDLYDMAALALIQKRVTEKEPYGEYGQVMVDEAQDFGAMAYYVMKQALHQCYFTIMGDVSQNINYETGMNSWEDLRQHIFGPGRAKFYMLAKSYRNTIEISEYAGKVLEKASFGAYKIQPVIRHGREVSFCQSKSLGEAAAKLVHAMQGRGYGTIAVICRDRQRAEAAEKELEGLVELAEKGDFQQGVLVLPVQLTKGLEFDGVVLWNPDGAAYQEQGRDAKLLYVAVTRALHELHIVYQDGLSPLLLG